MLVFNAIWNDYLCRLFSKINLVLFAAWFCIISQGKANAAESAQKLNVVFFLADDLGWTGLRCFGSDFYETPHLDQLAQQGVKFTNAYAACTVCSPTRASVLTGMYPARLHLTDFIAGQNRPWAMLNIPNWTKQLEHRYTTLPEALQAAGYRTAQVGKWHLEPPGDKQGAFAPTKHGFDVQVLKPKQAKGNLLPPGFNAKGESKQDFITDYLTDKAVEFIDESKDQPFFLYFAYHVPHTPVEGRPDLTKEFQAKVKAENIHKNADYAAMVKSMDDSVGRVLERLQRHGLSERTLVIFTSDNGGLTQRNGKLDNFTDNRPLRRGKGSAYEGGVRVPAIVRWPGVTPSGKVCEQPIMTIDYYPTILASTGVAGNKEHNASIDGVSLVPQLRNPQAKLERNLYWHYPHYHAGGDSPYSAIRNGPWRLIQFHEDQRLELYNLADDLSEQHDLSKTHADQAGQLLEQLRAWLTRVDAQLPTPNPQFDPAKAEQGK